MRRRVPFGLLVGLACLWPTLVQAAKPFAVIVGVGEFADPSIEPRATAETDARAFHDLLSDPQYFGATPERVILLTAKPDEKRKSLKATRENIVKALKDAVTKTEKDATILFVMFGRGASTGDQTCLFTAETLFKERAKTGLLGSDLEAELKNAKDRKLCVMLDIAFKGFDAGKETLAEPNLRDVLAALFGGEDKGEQPPPQDKVILLACIPSQTPLTKGENGLFAATAIEALRGAADTEGTGPDGLVTVDELVSYLEKNVPTQARELGKTQQEKESVPFIVGEETSHFPLTLNPKITATTNERLTKLKALQAGGKLTEDVAEAGIPLVTRMPKLKADQELRKNYEQLADGKLPVAEFLTVRAAILETRKLPEDEARKFSRTVVRAIEAVRTDYVKPIDVGQWAAYAVKGLYRRLEIAVPADVIEKLKNPKDLSRDDATELLADVRTRLGRREDLDDQKDADLTILMMFAELRDPYTTYYDKELIKKMDAPLRGEFRGVGIQIRRDLVRDGLLVVSPIKDSPAYKAGIQAGDLITTIKRETGAQGEPLPEGAAREISTKGMKTEQALEVILGKVGVPITLTVERDGKPKDYTIKRGLIAVETVLGVKRDAKDQWDFFIDPETKIGYVCLTQFAPTTARDLAKAVEELKDAGMKGLVLDLRFNPGGFLTTAIAICDLFLDETGVIVSVKYRNRDPEVWKGRRGGKDNIAFPMAVLINGQSASASEIVSACLQDYNRAVIIGERSYGKGSVQNVKEFNSTGGQIKLTTARYFPPLGRNIDKITSGGKPEDEWGVTPDKSYEIKLPREEAQDLAEFFREREIIQPKTGPAKETKPFRDRQLETAVEYLRVQIKAAKAGR